MYELGGRHVVDSPDWARQFTSVLAFQLPNSIRVGFQKSSRTQCAAVRIKRLLIKEPVQLKPRRVLSEKKNRGVIIRIYDNTCAING